jgi:hypothetical protein
VKDVRDKSIALTEAVRVLRTGGRFAFVDLFDDSDTYHGRERVIEAITNAGGDIESNRRLSEVVPLRWPMDTGKALKYAVLVVGVKRGADQHPNQSSTGRPVGGRPARTTFGTFRDAGFVTSATRRRRVGSPSGRHPNPPK